jgi:hypothetical protein
MRSHVSDKEMPPCVERDVSFPSDFLTDPDSVECFIESSLDNLLRERLRSIFPAKEKANSRVEEPLF